ncbi:Uncharacterized protein APZ42_032244 [Daphnia magna]|uniref:Uncharacterized protein n=1 Tax=Daphnia magna TaxID=35525 RepID=A0A164M5B6_9CRUS|nr:Uncharacterized protein APZ42_032244 [Daphnia magna]
MASGDSQDLDYFTEKMESDDDRIDIILSQMPLLENEEVEVAVFETIMEKEDDEVSHVSEEEMMESVGKEEEGSKGSTGHEEKNKKEHRSTEEERREASRGENESAIEIGNVDEEAENVTEKELLEKKRIIDREKREIEQKLREIKEKRNVEEQKRKRAAELLWYRRYPENQATQLVKQMEKRLTEAENAAKQCHPGLHARIRNGENVEHYDEDCDIAQTVHPSTPARAGTHTPRVSTSQCNNRLDNNGAREHPIQTANPSPPTGPSACISRDVRPSFPLSTPAPLFRTIPQLNQTRGKEETHESSTTLAARSERADSPFVCICDRCSQRNKIHSPLCENNGPIRGRSADLHHSAPERSEYQTHDTTSNLLSHPATRNPNNNTEHKTPDRDHAILYKIQSTDQTPVRPQARYTPAVTFEDQNPIPRFPNTYGPVYYPPQKTQNPHRLWFDTNRAHTLKRTEAYTPYPKEASYQTPENSTHKEA